MRINHNITALNTYRQLTTNTSNTSKSLEKLSSGLRINRAGDDAAGLAISEKMRGQIRGLDQASRNASDGISLIQTAEGALNETHSILQRMRELAVQAANDTNADESTSGAKDGDRDALQDEINQLTKEITRISNDTEFNTKKLLNGDFASNLLTFHIGANENQIVTLNIASMGASDLGSASLKMDAVDLTTQTGAEGAITGIDAAIVQVSQARSSLGAMQNRLEHTINNLGTSSENLSAAESRVRDVDMAKEMMEFTKNNILSQASQAMLAQANAQPQSVLQLLQ